MTKEIETFIDSIKNHPIFDTPTLFFIGGTALAHYLRHRVSYDIDIVSTQKLPVAQIKAFAFSLGARHIKDKNASAFSINTGEEIENYHLKFMVQGIKLEFSYFRNPIGHAILQRAHPTPIEEGATLKIATLETIVALKIFALFNRQKSRDLFDGAIILEKNLIDIAEVERIYSFAHSQSTSIRDYIDAFKALDDEGDNSLDFLPQHLHYKTFAKKSQNERFVHAREMFLTQYDLKQKESLDARKKMAIKNKKRDI
ncbi:MAG: hypothetical protein KU28_01385 [Sulfurovum sp. PC08-66]|nr:MAG: hypothetical protein KU28_01385 [Sulfurovum sp. PC08-66]KIM12600.1 MAG: hypothetical protein KU37_01500 [Sulfuricurvum sp. PC08-66]